MPDITVIRRDGTSADLAEDAVSDFRAALRGPLLAGGDPSYDDARTVWNAAVNRRPGLIARCADAADVGAAVRFARTHDLSLCVRGGGHSVAGTAVADGALMIDLSHMNGVRCRPHDGGTTVGPGATLGDVDHATQAHGLAVPAGIVSTTGVAGLTLGGGFGWLTRRYGYTCDNLAGADVVTADGRAVRADPDNNPDLFWALRGGGGNFGIVTAFDFRARPCGPTVLGGLRLHPLKEAPGLLQVFRQLTDAAPETLTCLLVLRPAPPAPFLPKDMHGKPICGIGVCYSGDDLDAGERLLAPLRRFGTPLADLIGPKPFTAVQTMLDATQPPGRCYYEKSEYLPACTPEVGEVMTDHTWEVTSPMTSTLCLHLGGAMARAGPDAGAVGHRDARFVVKIGASWPDGPGDPHVDWTRAFWRDLRPFGTGGSYVNFLDADETPDRVAAAYGDALPRLRAIKRDVDPENVFRINNNIAPADAAAV
ncbi:putative oxidoreductase [Caenispirillum salinarum AK4]|uniref:Putative oxidoreductase n=1 Tax=Caenispirillum salinarum AK4 TaxID=1238182 RepID=K9HMX7_9PROT|nr:FAD-binding oxidoreductase [Caenispirillum salinarum]EKV31633.1 putative oxidoreductase [Caenispirillum salinarum AK4]